ncbi:hypothetical protein N665_0045s0064 [Sinapis alba]|nr:hypothetical protein N665_0045s0064 [Sinapis alba]
MNLMFNISFLIFALCLGSNEAIMCNKNTLVFQNSLTRSQSTLDVHCKSKDNDLGDHFVKFKDPAYNFSFHDNVIFTTEFDCDLFWSRDNLVYHQTFASYIDHKPEKIMYNWIIQ